MPGDTRYTYSSTPTGLPTIAEMDRQFEELRESFERAVEPVDPIPHQPVDPSQVGVTWDVQPIVTITQKEYEEYQSLKKSVLFQGEA